MNKERKNLLVIVFILLVCLTYLAACNTGYPETERFRDSAHHWYDIHDENRVVNPLPDKPLHDVSEYEKIADNILLFQKINGGWAKNYDMQAILTAEQVTKVKAAKDVLNTTFDNGATHSQLTYLAEVYTLSGREKYKDAFLKGLDFVLEAQYENGGWPQFYPDTSGYRKHITFNDGAMMGVMELLGLLVNRNENYSFVDEKYYDKAKEAYDRGVECILDMQITENGKTTVWCQQHDHVTLEPQSARTFEPAAICNGESAEITGFLMKIENPDERVKQAVKNAVAWFEESAIEGIRVKRIDAEKEDFIYHTSDWDRIIVEDPDAPRIWTRFYELGTHVPMFCRRDGKIVYSLAEVERERRTGYSWYQYAPEGILDVYPVWLEKRDEN